MSEKKQAWQFQFQLIWHHNCNCSLRGGQPRSLPRLQAEAPCPQRQRKQFKGQLAHATSTPGFTIYSSNLHREYLHSPSINSNHSKGGNLNPGSISPWQTQSLDLAREKLAALGTTSPARAVTSLRDIRMSFGA